MAIRGEAREGDWLVAERQTAGRGRQGRAWSSPPGNLYASGLVELRDGDPPAPTLALVAGVAVVDALPCLQTKPRERHDWITPVASLPRYRLKWPNDLLVDGCKLAGILAERHENYVVIGVGINLAQSPELSDRLTTNLVKIGAQRSVNVVASELASAFKGWLLVWREQLPAIFAAWLARAHSVGTPLTTTLPDGTRIDGSFGGLTADGALQLRLPDGAIRVIHAGDVFLI